MTNVPEPTPARFDLGDYLHPVKAATTPAAARLALARPAPGFRPADPPSVGDSYWRDWTAVECFRRGEMRQTVWVRPDGETLALFDAPARVEFAYGEQVAFETEVNGRRCDRVDCPKQRTYSFQARGRRYVLASKSCPEEEVGRWISRWQ